MFAAAKKGWVKVTFESGLDEREYTVYRDTGAGYYVTDPRLQTRIAEKKEEVFRFLWQHLGLEPGTDLRSLFRQAIGVPQGTFTAIFLEGATERKVAFDRLLKVEEYRQAAEKLRETSRYLDSQVTGVPEGIRPAEGELARSEIVATDNKAETENKPELAAEIETLTGRISRNCVRLSRLDERERSIVGLKTVFERSSSELERSQLVFRQLEQSVENAAAAAAKAAAAVRLADRHFEILAG
ncbi:MAG: hypothetical protein IPP63_13835 [Chloracidobacterium sp.]|nr:hypothetical protein [Chloracidobacterium sp.]